VCVCVCAGGYRRLTLPLSKTLARVLEHLGQRWCARTTGGPVATAPLLLWPDGVTQASLPSPLRASSTTERGNALTVGDVLAMRDAHVPLSAPLVVAYDWERVPGVLPPPVARTGTTLHLRRTLSSVSDMDTEAEHPEAVTSSPSPPPPTPPPPPSRAVHVYSRLVTPVAQPVRRGPATASPRVVRAAATRAPAAALSQSTVQEDVLLRGMAPVPAAPMAATAPADAADAFIDVAALGPAHPALPAPPAQVCAPPLVKAHRSRIVCD
jgi:hypothetical protein